jgi:hypothetical protein
MGIATVLNDEKFDLFFSFMLGIGIICMLRPICAGSECNKNKPPAEKDFDQYIYRMAAGKCYEFKSEIIDCPSNGAIEAFQQSISSTNSFSNRSTQIHI